MKLVYFSKVGMVPGYCCEIVRMWENDFNEIYSNVRILKFKSLRFIRFIYHYVWWFNFIYLILLLIKVRNHFKIANQGEYILVLAYATPLNK